MQLNLSIRRKECDVETEPCQIDKVVMLSDDEFLHFKHHLLEEYDFLVENRDVMGFSDDGVRHGILVTSENESDGVFVDAQGANYARYHAYVPHAHQLLEQTPYASLAEFNNRMQKITDSCVELTLQRHTDGDFYIPRVMLPSQNDSPWFQYELLGEMLSERPELASVETMSSEILVNVAPEFREVPTEDFGNGLDVSM